MNTLGSRNLAVCGNNHQRFLGCFCRYSRVALISSDLFPGDKQGHRVSVETPDRTTICVCARVTRRGAA